MLEKTILIVEDEENLRNSLGELLAYNKYNVWMAENGVKALELLKLGKFPDIIISDIIMPEMDGIALCKNLQNDERLKFIPFIFLSAKVDLDDIRTGMNIGADDYITKPVRYTDLIHAINVRLQKKQLLEEKLAQDIIQTNGGNSTQKQAFLKKLALFSDSEMRVLKALPKLKVSKAIAQHLFLSIKTVQNHRSNMVRKLGFSGQNSLLAFAVECYSLGLL